MHARMRFLKGMACALAISVSLLAQGVDMREPAAERRPDAAQAVQEGNVNQWLEHYQRERGAAWPAPATERDIDRAPRDQPTAPARQPVSVPDQADR